MRHVTDQAAEGQDRPARSYRVEALAKGLRLLSYFTAERPALYVKDLVSLSGIPMPTVFRLVATLMEEGYLERTVDGMVRPGTGVLVLGFAAMQGLDLVQMSEPVLRDLAAETGETVNLGVLYGDQVLFVARIPRRDTLVAANLRVGSTVPAVFSSIGKTILAYLSEDELSQRVSVDSFRGTWGRARSPPLMRSTRSLSRPGGTAILSSATRPSRGSARLPPRSDRPGTWCQPQSTWQCQAPSTPPMNSSSVGFLSPSWALALRFRGVWAGRRPAFTDSTVAS
jgi:IclR family transcriptional regulator, pca regulon regulatory protein